MRSKTLAHNIGHHIEKLANDGIEGWEMTASEVIEEMCDLAHLLEKLAKGEDLSLSELRYLKSLNLHEVIVPEEMRSKKDEIIVAEDMRTEVLIFVYQKMEDEILMNEVFKGMYTPCKLLEILKAIKLAKPINDLYYADAVIERFNLK